MGCVVRTSGRPASVRESASDRTRQQVLRPGSRGHPPGSSRNRGDRGERRGEPGFPSDVPDLPMPQDPGAQHLAPVLYEESTFGPGIHMPSHYSPALWRACARIPEQRCKSLGGNGPHERAQISRNVQTLGPRIAIHIPPPSGGSLYERQALTIGRGVQSSTDGRWHRVGGLGSLIAPLPRELRSQLASLIMVTSCVR